nr:uncharacterized protein LOC109761297 [Aegilops tauschii subsp. strangulata]
MMRGKSPRATSQGGAKKRRAAPSLFGGRPKKPKGSAAATKRDEAAAKAIRFHKAGKEPQLVSAAPLSLEKSAAASIVGSAETSTTTRRIDPAADLREARERNVQEAREEQEAARLEKAEAEKEEASALKKLAEAEAADATKKQAEEAAHHQSAIFITPLNSAPPPPEFVAQTGEVGNEHPIMERDDSDVAMLDVIVPPPPPSGSAQGEQPTDPPMPPAGNEDYHNLRAAAFSSKVQELDQRAVDLSESRKANAALQQQLGEANTMLRAKEEECSKLAEERDRLVAQLAKHEELLKKARKEAEDKETGLLDEFAT